MIRDLQPVERTALERPILLLAVLWYLITAWFSTGYLHGDEHYQILEFAGSIAGWNRPEDLAWEHAARIRPALQPILAYLFLSGAEWSGLSDPFIQAFLLRAISGLLAVFLLHRMWRTVRHLLASELHTAFLALTLFLWFMPMLGVRFSSENWSGLLLLPVMSAAMAGRVAARDLFRMGVLLGLAFQFRYQVALCAMGLFAWYAFVQRAPRQHLVMGAFGFLIVFAAGLIVDRWFYGEWVVAAWNYLRYNVVDGRAAEYGTAPWYHYPYLIFRFAFFPIGIIILLATAAGLYLERRGPLTWAFIPFLLVHMALAHKELRFLFPLVPWVPFMILRVWGAIASPVRERTWVRWTMGAWCVVNTIALVVASVTPQATGRADIMVFVRSRSIGTRTVVNVGPKADPFDPWNGLVARFYRPEVLDIRKWEGPDADTLIPPSLFILERRQWETGPVTQWAEQHGREALTTSYAPSLRPLLKLYGGINLQDELIVLGRR